ncbi:urea amidolyase associated protein UAAP2 [Piscinibacter sp.]|uniref:urea amidolyase associated protein UAAP2 n=1 Tax=Piscinibacter sp. TaxID=1903157 RepID=UPI002CD92371|nr:urea amidolyase associated protein UAAP2 [Albitalea sp.]HUG25803.1 urea amidolyase associated protein UAAP2 [Albitalea sp.]
MNVRIVESDLDPADAILDTEHPPGTPWMHEIKKGQVFRIVDLEGNQAVDTIFYNARDTQERYSLIHTMLAQENLYLGVGTQIMSSEGRPMLTIIADTCGRHDTVGGGACSSESNTVRYALEKRFMHSCRDNYMLGIAEHPAGLHKRDVVSNINFFMNVPMTPGGRLTFEDGISGPGKYIEMRAEMDILILISNCPQLNNPANGYNPTPVRYLVWGAPAVGSGAA